MTIERVLSGLALVMTVIILALTIKTNRLNDYVVQVKGNEDWVTVVAISPSGEILSNPSLKVKVLTLHNDKIESVMLSPKAKEE